jgi:tyrosine-protein kinase Etk/Wzc
VVAVDADLRTPQLHRAFGIEPERGLAVVLEGEDTWRHAISAAAAGRVDVLAAGVPVQNPGRLLGSPSLAAVLYELRVDYDAVVLAAPPLLSVNDAELVAQAADGVLLVLLRGRVTQDEAQRASRRLSLLSTPLLGVVVADPLRMPGRWRMAQAVNG